MQENSDFIDLYRPKDGYVFVVTYGRSGSTLTLNYLKGTSKNCANRAAGVGRTGHSAAGA